LSLILGDDFQRIHIDDKFVMVIDKIQSLAPILNLMFGCLKQITIQVSTLGFRLSEFTIHHSIDPNNTGPEDFGPSMMF
jgi:hypothetical protein